MKKKIAVLIEDLYHILELYVPYYRLKEEGYEVILIGTGSKNSYKSKEGHETKVDMEIKNADHKEFDGVVIPGGFAPDKIRRYPEILNFVKNIYNANKLTAAICHGPWVLISARILKNKNATSTSAIKDDMINAQANYSDQEVVIDKNLITSREPKDLPAFCKAIVNFLKSN